MALSRGAAFPPRPAISAAPPMLLPTPGRPIVLPSTDLRRARVASVARGSSIIVLAAAALGAVQFSHPTHSEPIAPLATVVTRINAGLSFDAFGSSREVRVRFALPTSEIEFPLEVSGNPAALTYEWVSTRDSSTSDAV